MLGSILKAAIPHDLKTLNLNNIKSILSTNQHVTKSELAELTGLSVVTVNKLIQTLLETREIKEFSNAVTTGGRKAVSYCLNADFQHVLIIRLQANKQEINCLFSVHNLLGQLIVQDNIESSLLTLPLLIQRIRLYLNQFPDISCIVIGIPGEEIEGQLRIIDFPLLLNLNLRKELESAFTLPVLLENDINAAVLGYSRQVDDPEIKSLIGIYYPEKFPPGAGILLNGKIYKGKNGIAGEIKNIPLNINWNDFDYSTDELQINLEKTLISLIGLYDPHSIIIYAKYLGYKKDSLQALTLHLTQAYPYISLPQITLSMNFEQDYALGLVSIGLSYLKENAKTRWDESINSSTKSIG